jgi:hypothetical protein
MRGGRLYATSLSLVAADELTCSLNWAAFGTLRGMPSHQKTASRTYCGTRDCSAPQAFRIGAFLPYATRPARSTAGCWTLQGVRKLVYYVCKLHMSEVWTAVRWL